MKILGIGLSRTGTSSLHEALLTLGFSSVHYPQDLDTIARQEAASDTPVVMMYKLLDRRHPGAKFIYTERPLAGWLESCEVYWRTHPIRSEFQRQVRLNVFGGEDFDRDRFAEAYEKHERDVAQHFANRPADLLRLRICEGEGWTRLCEFLGKPVPTAPFPHANSRGNGASPAADARQDTPRRS